ncbi:MAG: DNA-3-methyladenine glycosylase [Sphingobacteriia bacterium]|nr:DNA-3-methyladenine glycosylase [Sphingobacteriia bacterium]
MKKLDRSFYEQDSLEVARSLLGKTLVFNNYKGIITETEAYMGFEDPASHAFRGRTKRTEIMFGEAGFSYVYLIYGMYYCLNFVTEKKDFPSAILIRGLLIYEPVKLLLDGPGKICKLLGITKEQNGVDIINSENFYVADTGQTLEYSVSSRIGIKTGLDKMWRFVANLKNTPLTN